MVRIWIWRTVSSFNYCLCFFLLFPVCGSNQNVTLDVGDTYPLLSIYHPNHYLNNIECIYFIKAPPGRRIRVHFVAFSLASNYEIHPEIDFLRFVALDTNGEYVHEPQVYNLFRPSPILDIVSLTNTLEILFHTDFRGTDTGFELELTETDEIGKFYTRGGRKRFSGSRIFDRFSHRFTRNLLLKALKLLLVGYVMLKIIMTHNLPGFKNEPQSEYHFFKCFLWCAVSMTVYS